MQQTGTTLAELLVTLAIAAILLTTAIPGFASLMQSSRLTGATNDLLASLHLARSEAIKRNARAVLCPSADGASCAPSGGWHQGWLVFHDADNNAERDDGEALIQVRPALPDGIRATGNNPVARYVSYVPSGATWLVSDAFQAGRLTLCSESASAAARQIVISSTGRARTVKLDSCP
jgi:type IV fimbrial biogenesis protein FimT